MPANVQSIAFVGDAPWHRLGTKVPATVSAAEMIDAADLNWVVEKRPGPGARPIRRLRGEDIYPRYELVRVARGARVEEDVSFGMVSRRYEPLQNRDVGLPRKSGDIDKIGKPSCQHESATRKSSSRKRFAFR